MIINLFLIFSTLGNAIDYFSYYKTYILWDNDIQNNYKEHNPILNNLIKEPVNTFTNLIYYKSYNIYSKYPLLDRIQKVTVSTLVFGSMFMHGSKSEYGGFLDIIGMVYVFSFYIIKDLIILKQIKLNSRLLEILPIIMILIRLFSRHIFNGKNSLADLKLFKLLVGLKIINEFKKNIKNKNTFIICSTVWNYIIYSVNVNNEFYKDTNQSLYTNNPCTIMFIYSLLLQTISIKVTQKNRTKCVKGIVFILIGALFQEKDFFNFTNPYEISIFQYHSLWHILSAYGLYYIDSYLFDNL